MGETAPVFLYAKSPHGVLICGILVENSDPRRRKECNTNFW